MVEISTILIIIFFNSDIFIYLLYVCISYNYVFIVYMDKCLKYRIIIIINMFIPWQVFMQNQV